jgi:predicted deacylase
MTRNDVDCIDYAALTPGRHQLRYLVPGTTLPDGSPLAIPVTILVGRNPRPRLTAIAGVHGNEYPGPLALLEIAAELDPASIEGTVVLVPFANPLAYNAGTRVSPEDGVNLNRVFPGDPNGSLTLRLAHALVDGIVQDADLAVDLHSAEATGVMMPMSGFREHSGPVALASARAAAAFGLEMSWMMRWAPGTLSTALNQRGIPAVGCEVGGGGIASAQEIELYRDGVMRLVRGEQRPLPPEVEVMEDLTAPTSGILDIKVQLRDEVRAGQLLAHLFPGAPASRRSKRRSTAASSTSASSARSAPARPSSAWAVGSGTR